MALSAARLHELYGAELERPPFSEANTARQLKRALAARRPPVEVSDGICLSYIERYRAVAGKTIVASARELQDKYAEAVHAVALENPTEYKLRNALSKRSPGIEISAGVARKWLSDYFRGGRQVREVDSAGHLELQCGDSIRSEAGGKTAEELRDWLLVFKSVRVPLRSCQHWLSRDWSTSNRVLRREDVEAVVGQRLRLPQYKDCFADEAAALALSEQLAEGQPSVFASARLLLSWHEKCHPDSGPLQVNTVAELDAQLGEEDRAAYAGLKRATLARALSLRQRPIAAGLKVCHDWLEKHARPARVLKRPAGAAAGPAVKRPAGAGIATAAPSSAARSSSSSAPVVAAAALCPAGVMELRGADAIEAACGARYRREVCDLGLGHSRTEMHKRLRAWGYGPGREACQEWLRRYLRGDGVLDGGVATYRRHREELLRWFHIDGLGPQALQERFSAELGLYAHRAHLFRWVEDQKLPNLEMDNQEIHAHACGEYVLEQLQNGVAPDDVAQALLREYLVKTTGSRVAAYRRYREQCGEYWSTDKLERRCWEFLYQQVKSVRSIFPTSNRAELRDQAVALRYHDCC